MSKDLQAADDFRLQTRNVLLSSLGKAQGEKHSLRELPHFLKQFFPLGNKLQQSLSHEQITRLVRALEETLSGSRKEQLLKTANRCPSLEEFWEYRMKTNLMDVIFALMWPASIPPGETVTLLEDYCDNVNKAISIINDIVSLKKEIMDEVPLNLVLIFFSQGESLQDSVSHANAMYRDAMGRISQLEERINRSANPETRDFMTLCQNLISGFIVWSINSPRYGLSLEGQCDDEITVLLPQVL
ncbi:Terpenoid synthase [Penicillium italicum]|uniref:Terpene synthase n=1 Tax=Penicillium italicum TaxID=40296 RepID=A0A0A2L9S1_PENIT|nr:Terpenoid synthase [Penicillium italicum]